MTDVMEGCVQFACVSKNGTSVLQQNNKSVHFNCIFSTDTDGDREDSDTTSHNSAQFHREREFPRERFRINLFDLDLPQ